MKHIILGLIILSILVAGCANIIKPPEEPPEPEEPDVIKECFILEDGRAEWSAIFKLCSTKEECTKYVREIEELENNPFDGDIKCAETKFKKMGNEESGYIKCEESLDCPKAMFLIEEEDFAEFPPSIREGFKEIFRCENDVCEVTEGAGKAFGIFKPAPERFLPERCTGSPGIDCIDKASITENSIEIALRNNVGYKILVKDVAVNDNSCEFKSWTGCSPGNACAYPAMGTEFEANNNEQIRIKVFCDGISGDRYKGDIIMTYENTETGLVHMATTSIAGRVEP